MEISDRDVKARTSSSWVSHDFAKGLLCHINALAGKNDLERHIKDWDDFLDIAPKSDDVEQYLKDHPDKCYVPFRKTLFRGKYFTLIF